MSWMEKLLRTYENNVASIGATADEYATPLLPIYHAIQNAHVHVVLSEEGELIRAEVVPKSEAKTIIPATEKSAGRTSGAVPHPLCDKLQYVAGDYREYGGKKASCFAQYLVELGKWCSSPCSHPKVRAVYRYVKKGRLIKDLVELKVLHVGSDGTLLRVWEGDRDKTPEIFRLLQGSDGQSGALVRWSVELPSDPQASLWTDRAVWKSWADYCMSMQPTKGLCYVTGEERPLATNHPRRIRSPADGGKLISSNDRTGFTFRGRFLDASEAYGVGFEVTQKAHSALRWLIGRQGWRDGDQTVVTWAVSGTEIPDPLSDTLSLLHGDSDNVGTNPGGYTAQEVGTRLSKLISGYSVKLGPTDDVVIIALDSASPGRIAIRFYRELSGSEFLDRVLSWHDPARGCTWQQNLGKSRVFVGSPAPRDIGAAAYGRRLDEKLRKATTERLLPCIVDGAPVPRDLVDSCVGRACNRAGLEHWEWETTLGIACALYKYSSKERRYAMALERERHSRDYLYGRLLALAERLEGQALYVAGENRETNAARLMQRFAERPHSTWLTIETSLAPYKARLQSRRPGFLINVMKEVDDVFNRFSPDEFLSDKRLSGEFLLGYHCERAALWEKQPNADDNDEDKESNAQSN